MQSDPTYLGTVQDVKGSTVSVSLAESSISAISFVRGEAYKVGQIGSFVRIPLGYIDLFGVVSQVGASAVPASLTAIEPHGYRWLTIQLVGEGRRRGEFIRGVSQYPTIGDNVHVVTEQDLLRVYASESITGNHIRVGHLATSETVPALVDVDKLVTRHSAVLGTTGAGKSTTVAGIIAALSDRSRFPSSRIVILDVHGEYATALKDLATVFRMGPGRDEQALFVPYWAMTFDEFLAVTFGAVDDSSRGAIMDKISEMKVSAIQKGHWPGVSEKTLTIDTPVPFSIHQLWFDLHCQVNGTHTAPPSGQSDRSAAMLLDKDGHPVQPGDPLTVTPPKYRPQTQAAGVEKIYLSASSLNIRRQLEALASRLRDSRFDFLFRPGPWSPALDGTIERDLDSLLADWIGGPKPVTILDLSGVPHSVLTNLIGAVLRIIYDSLFWARKLSEGGVERPLLIVLEEAHAYLGAGDNGPAGQAVRRIVKEGRKYGIGCMIISQRPAEIDSTILSQCGTTFAMRLSNSTDRAHVTSSVTDNLESLLHMLPVLRTGEAIIIGEAVRLPLRALIEAPPKHRRPDSRDPLVFVRIDETRGPESPSGWNRPRKVGDYVEVVTLWRKQDPRSTRAIETSPAMTRTAVVSSNLAGVGYDASTQTLEVEFQNGNVYQYFDVPQVAYESLIGAESVGRFFNAEIRGSYRYARM